MDDEKICGNCIHWDEQPPSGPGQAPTGPCTDPNNPNRVSMTQYEGWHGCHTGGFDAGVAPVTKKIEGPKAEGAQDVGTLMRTRQPCAVISGTSDGIGLVLRDALLFQGWKVFTIERTQIEKSHDYHFPYAGDVKDHLDTHALFSRVSEKCNGRAPDVLVNNAAVNKIQFLEEFRTDDFETVIDTVLKGTFNMCQQYVRLITTLERRSGEPKGIKPFYRIVNVGSLAGRVPMTATLPYNTAKAGLNMMTKQMARELAPKIVTCAVNPGKVLHTGMTRQLDTEIPEVRGWTKEFADEYQLGVIPMKKYTLPDDVVSVLLFAMTAPDFINGSVIDFDGGVS